MNTFITNKLTKNYHSAFFSLIVMNLFPGGRPVSGVVRKFKCPLKETQPSCPGSGDLNWTGKGC